MLIKYTVSGMTCAACSARVEKVALSIPGVNRAEVNLLAGTMKIDAESMDVSSKIVEAVSAAGYKASILGESPSSSSADNTLTIMKWRIVCSAVFLAALMYLTMGHMIGLMLPRWVVGTENALVNTLLQLFLTLPVLYINRSYFVRGSKALIHCAPNMDSLIAVGSGAAMLYGVVSLFLMADAAGNGDLVRVAKYSKNLYFESAAMILTLITLGKFLETRAKGKTGDAIKKLMDMNPKTAFVRVGGDVVELPVEEVSVGDTIIVRAGGRIPVDGTVILGHAVINQSALTGESVPVEKCVGDTVAAATINVEGYLEVCADKVGEDTTFSQVIRMVQDSGGSKAPIARLADKIAGIFVPTVMAISLITCVVWLLIGETFDFALTSAISVLVISCPCALGLATPVAIMVGVGRGASMGVLFKNAEVLENLHKVNCVVLDKTGTLTTGMPAVTDIYSVAVDERELLAIAAALEFRSEHPFAKAIMAKNGDAEYPESSEFETIPGRGVSTYIDGIKYYGGNKSLMDSLMIAVPQYPEITEQGKTPLYFASEDGTYLGMFAAADVLKKDSKQAISVLKGMHLNVIMLTGDNLKTATAIAADAGINNVIADVMPGDKASAIERLRGEGSNVLMVGDGINDAPALVSADVGMAIGGGTDIAMETADVVLANGSLKGVCNAIALSKATIRNIKQNLFWAFFYNCLGIPIAAGVLYPAFQIQLSPMIAAAAMSCSSFFVVFNALRLRFFKPLIKSAEDVLSAIVPKEEKKMEVIIKVEGMMCPHCKARVEDACKAVAGITNAVVDLQEKQVTVTGDADVEALEKAIIDAGYEVIK